MLTGLIYYRRTYQYFLIYIFKNKISCKNNLKPVIRYREQLADKGNSSKFIALKTNFKDHIWCKSKAIRKQLDLQPITNSYYCMVLYKVLFCIGSYM